MLEQVYYKWSIYTWVERESLEPVSWREWSLLGFYQNLLCSEFVRFMLHLSFLRALPRHKLNQARGPKNFHHTQSSFRQTWAKNTLETDQCVSFYYKTLYLIYYKSRFQSRWTRSKRKVASKMKGACCIIINIRNHQTVAPVEEMCDGFLLLSYGQTLQKE